MRLVFAALAITLTSVPVSAQDGGIFVFDFGRASADQRLAMADRVVADAQQIAEAAVILCSTEANARQLAHNRAVSSLLVERGAARARIHDAGVCTPAITGRMNDDIGANRVWLALTTVPFLENFRREQLGY